ncbi:MAG: sporulation protein YqfD [Eubacteriales bacterium]
MLIRLWSFLTGYVSLIVEGKSLEKLINMAVSRGLYLWDVRWVDPDRVTVKLRLNGFKALRHIARRTKSSFRITGKGGLPFSIARLKKRKLLPAGAIMSVLLVYLMSSFIWFVDVKGNKNLPAEVVIRVAEDAGLAMGTLKIGLDKDRIEKYIKNEIPQVSWVGVEITGTKAVIEIAEKVIIPPADNSPANVVAEKEGLIKELLVLCGKPAVNEGDMVKKGDTLITGVIRPEPKPDEQQGGEKPENTILPDPIKFVRARGIVRAKVWYDGYGEGRLVDMGTKRTGRQTEVLGLRVFGKELILKGPKTPPYRDFVTGMDVKKPPEWRNIRIPVEIVTTIYYEVEKYRDIIGVSRAKSNASQQALAIARAKVPTDAKILRESSEEIQDRGGSVIRVKVILETLEEIGRVEPIKPEDFKH